MDRAKQKQTAFWENKARGWEERNCTGASVGGGHALCFALWFCAWVFFFFFFWLLFGLWCRYSRWRGSWNDEIHDCAPKTVRRAPRNAMAYAIASSHLPMMGTKSGIMSSGSCRYRNASTVRRMPTVMVTYPGSSAAALSESVMPRDWNHSTGASTMNMRHPTCLHTPSANPMSTTDRESVCVREGALLFFVLSLLAQLPPSFLGSRRVPLFFLPLTIFLFFLFLFFFFFFGLHSRDGKTS